MKSLRIGVVGAGYISRTYHCPSLTRLKKKYPQLELAAICDMKEERARELASRFGFGKAYTNIGEMIVSEKLHGACILVDPGNMKKVALQFIRRRIPVLLEKPPGADSSEVRELVSAAEKHGVANLVALNRRFMPLARRMKELIEHAERPPQLLSAEMLRHERTEPEFAFGTAVHAIDLMRYLGGDVAGLRVKKLELAANKAPAYIVEFDFESGLPGRLSILPETGMEAERYTVHGNNWTITLEAPLDWTVDYPGRLLFFEGRKRHFIQDNRLWPESMRDHLEITGFLGEVEHFIACLAGGDRPQPSLADCLQSVEIAEAVLAGKNVKFG